MAVTRPLGFNAAGTTAGLKRSGKPDLALITCDEGDRVTTAASFTRNVVIGAPIELGKRWRADYQRGDVGPVRAVLINSGSANAATGPGGIDDAVTCAKTTARALGCDPRAVLTSSTGVVGQRLDVGTITNAVPAIVGALGRGEAADADAAQAILTTDLVTKTAHREVEIDGHQIHLGAITKGSGMIAPRLDGPHAGAPAHATMLAFITTDAPFTPSCLQSTLDHACARSFERISVDAHPSCSDMIVVMSSGLAPIDPIHVDTPAHRVIAGAMRALCEDLAEQIVRDGEGATRTFRVEVTGAETEYEAAAIARAIVDSPLVKCAVHGKDPNWGRVVTAAGNAGVRFDPLESALTIGSTVVYRGGVPTGVDPEDPDLIAQMSQDTVTMRFAVGHGPGSAWFMGCDLSDGYVRINADYTT